MTRKEFVQMCSVLGIGLSIPPGFSACANEEGMSPKFTGKVIIIGAGAGGLSAAYLLRQQGIEVEILEASSVYGGRMRINTAFADFPIPLGAEWLETSPDVFQKIVQNPSVQVSVQTIVDAPDRKFIHYSWFNFFEEYIVPSIADKISFNTIVKSINYTDNQVYIDTQNGQQIADKVIVAVPLKILQLGEISFEPSLPQSKLDAISGATIWPGYKAFFAFTEKFYDHEYAFSISPETAGQKIYYDAAFGQNTTMNILGLFVVGTPALDFISRSDEEAKQFILAELDGLYSNKATPNYVKHITQNWNNEPFIKSGYLSDHADWRAVRELGKSVAGKVYFAGGAYTDGEDWVSVHTAAQSAKNAVEEMLK